MFICNSVTSGYGVLKNCAPAKKQDAGESRLSGPGGRSWTMIGLSYKETYYGATQLLKWIMEN